MNNVHFQYWEPEDIAAVQEVASFSVLAQIMCRIAMRHPRPVHVISGAISTGGFGNVYKNLNLFRAVVEYAHLDLGWQVFSQIAFEEAMGRLSAAWHASGGRGYCKLILEICYDSLFATGQVCQLDQIYNWRESFGAVYENESCDRFNIPRHELGEKLCMEALRKYGRGVAPLVAA